jgi:hypothetical protein
MNPLRPTMPREKGEACEEVSSAPEVQLPQPAPRAEFGDVKNYIGEP